MVWRIVRQCLWDSEITGLLSWFWVGLSVYLCFSFTLCWNHPGPTCRKLEKDIEKLKPRRTIDVSQLNDRELPGMGIFQPAFIMFGYLKFTGSIYIMSFLSAALHRELLWYLKCIIVDDMLMIFVSFRITSCTQDNVASAVRKSTAEKVSRGLGRKDWGFETESPARRSPFVHIFSLGLIELSSKHIRRVSQNILMPTCINHPVYVSESGQFNGLTVVDEFCAHPSKAESKRFLEAHHLWKLYAEEVYPLTYPQINRAKYLDFNSGVVSIVSHGDDDRTDDLNRCFLDIWYQMISVDIKPFSSFFCAGGIFDLYLGTKASAFGGLKFGKKHRR